MADPAGQGRLHRATENVDEMEQDRQIVMQEPGERESARTIPSQLLGAITRTSAIIGHRIFGTVALRSSQPIEKETEIRTRKPLALPNFYLASFIALVVIPSFLCVVYLTFVASNQYVAEARFAVKSAQFDLGHDKTNSGTALGGISLPVLADQDAYIIANYIDSRTIIDDLAGRIDIRAIFERPEADFWARLKTNASPEELADYWQKMVSTYVDSISGIVIVTARAFRPADAQALAAAIVDASEKLANDVSARARQAMMKQAEEEMRRSEGMVRSALLDMRRFRDRQGYIDPLSAANTTSTLLMQDMAEKIRLENDFFVASKAMSSKAPTVVEMKTRLDALDDQIDQLKAKLTGNSPQGHTIAASLATFEELELKRIFAEKLYTMAQDALERAKLRAEQQHLYLSTFVPPGLPQDAKYPQRLGLSLLLPLGFFMLWSILAMAAASIEDHRN
jgi:capsular polysaccharide transport system permease protein